MDAMPSALPATLPSIATLGAQFRAGERSPVDLAQTLLQRIDATDGHTRAYITVFHDAALAQARAAQARIAGGTPRGPLDGIPLSIKDILPTACGRTTAGSRVLRDHVAGHDAPIVARLDAAGAVILGKNNLHEYAFGVTSNNRCFGRVVNPAFPALLPGGSSGGTAAAIAAGLTVAGVGSDTGGSIRIPAACCELVGLKPTYGRVDARDAIPQAWSLDHLGPMARSVADVHSLLAGLAGEDPSPAHSADAPLRIGVDTALLQQCSPAVQAAFETVLAQLRAHGHRIDAFDHPDWHTGFQAWLVIMLGESASYHTENLRRRAQDIDPGILPFLLAGRQIPASHYLDAQRYRRLWTRQLRDATRNVDFLLNPTFPCAVPARDADTVATGQGMQAVRDALVAFQWPANLTGWPSLALPTPLRVDGGPFSLMLTRPDCDDFALLDLAQSLEHHVLPSLA